MKKIILVVVSIVLALALSGCFLTMFDKPVIPITFIVENATEYEIVAIWLHSPHKVGSSSPIHDILNEDAGSLKSGEYREFTISLYEDQIENGGLLSLRLNGEEEGVGAGTISIGDGYVIVISETSEGEGFYASAYSGSYNEFYSDSKNKGSGSDRDEEEENIDGVIIGSPFDGADEYIGWWRLCDPSDEMPFSFFEITTPYSEVNCYDETGELVDAGFFDYNAQRALNGNPLIVLVLGELGEYAGYPYSTESGEYMDISEWNGSAKGLFKTAEAPDFG